MAKKKKSELSKKQVRSAVARLLDEAGESSSRVDALEDRVARLEKAAARAKRRVKELQAAAGQAEPAPPVVPAGEEPTAVTDVAPVAEPATDPDAHEPQLVSGWTLTRLRQEAKARKISGYSRMSKVELVRLLSPAPL